MRLITGALGPIMGEDAVITLIAMAMAVGEMHPEVEAVAVGTQMQDSSRAQMEDDLKFMRHITSHQKYGMQSQQQRKGKLMKRDSNTGPIRE